MPPSYAAIRTVATKPSAEYTAYMSEDVSDTPLFPCPEPFNMAAHVLQHADRLNDKVAISILGQGEVEDWTFGALQSAILGTATGLLNAGLDEGDIAFTRLGNTVDFPIAYLAAIAVGIIPVPLSAQLTGREVLAAIQDTGAKAILLDPSLETPDTAIQTISLSDLRTMRGLPAARYVFGDPNRLSYILFTSGTSGKPRAVCHAHRAIWARETMRDGWTDLRETDRMMHAGAFNWSFTLGTGLMDPWRHGATALIPKPGTAPDLLMTLAAQNEATIFAAVPGVYRKILQTTSLPQLPKLRHCLAAGETLSENIRNKWQVTVKKPIYEAYGMTECSTFLSASPAHPARAGHIGTVQNGRHVAVLDINGAPISNQVGEIAIHRTDPGLMMGYLNQTDDTNARFKGDWFMTGDLAITSADGQISYAGRADDMMNASGYRVSPIEIETVMMACPGIEQIGVTDVEVKQDVRIIVGFYIAINDLPNEQLDTFAAQHLAAYKQPKQWVRIQEMPLNPNGKLQRSKLRRLLTPLQT